MKSATGVKDVPAHEEYLVVFVTVQNLVVIGAVISIVCKFKYFAR